MYVLVLEEKYWLLIHNKSKICFLPVCLSQVYQEAVYKIVSVCFAPRCVSISRKYLIKGGAWGLGFKKKPKKKNLLTVLTLNSFPNVLISLAPQFCYVLSGALAKEVFIWVDLSHRLNTTWPCLSASNDWVSFQNQNRFKKPIGGSDSNFTCLDSYPSCSTSRELCNSLQI